MNEGGDMYKDSEESERVMAAILRSKTPAENFEMVMSMWRFARDLITCRIRTDHPDWSDERVARESVARLSHGAA